MQPASPPPIITNEERKAVSGGNNNPAKKIYVYLPPGPSLNFANKTPFPATLCIESAGSTVSKNRGTTFSFLTGK